MDKPETLFAGDCIRTFTGKYLNVFEPDPEMICIEDIAHALSFMPRFAGHLPKMLSVAEHSVKCCIVAPIELQLDALMHDASEAYLMDIPRPIKKRLPEYKTLEDQLTKVIYEKFALQYPIHPEVKEIDKGMLIYEHQTFVLQTNIERYEAPWSSEKAKEAFLHYFNKLTKVKEVQNG